MKIRILLLVIYIEYKPSANYAQDGEENNVIIDYQNYFYQFYCKQDKLAEPQKIAHGPQGFCRTQFEGHTLKVQKWRCCMEAI
jgi:hypothetical protein